MIDLSFGERFKMLRLEKGLKQQELADDLNKIYGYTYSKSSISQYENDKRKPEINPLIDFADYFDVSIDYLLKGDTGSIFKSIDEAMLYIKSYLKNPSNIDKDKASLFKEVSTFYFDSLDL